jgi:hypothetical protein
LAVLAVILAAAACSERILRRDEKQFLQTAAEHVLEKLARPFRKDECPVADVV